jgi:(p)ppGpp synthase/HD superfamily hydrolase
MASNKNDTTAQTNLQLYRQLMDQHWDDEALGLVASAYELALALFAVQVRPNGKPFICHLVGTASVAAGQCDRPEVTAASLLHAAYTLGDWGDGKRGRTPARRAVIERAVGTVAETLVAKYTTMPWGYGATNDFLDRSADMSGEDRTLVLMRLANEVDEWADGGLQFSTKGDFPRFQAENVKAVATLARALGYVQIGDYVERAFEEDASMSVPSYIRIKADLPGKVRPQSPLLRFALRLGAEIDKGRILRRGTLKVVGILSRLSPKSVRTRSDSVAPPIGG